MQKLAQFRTAESIEKAAENQGTAGLGVGLGAGMAFGNMMSNTLGNQTNQQQNTNVPPPPPGSQYYIAVNGQQTGPFTLQQMQQQAQTGGLKRDSMIWKPGMEQWAQANTLSELANVLSNVPPPPPLG
jgi:hypothetical protein